MAKILVTQIVQIIVTQTAVIIVTQVAQSNHKLEDLDQLD